MIHEFAISHDSNLYLEILHCMNFRIVILNYCDVRNINIEIYLKLHITKIITNNKCKKITLTTPNRLYFAKISLTEFAVV